MPPRSYSIVSLFLLCLLPATQLIAQEKVCAIYDSILSFDSQTTIDAAIGSQPPFLPPKNIRSLFHRIDSSGKYLDQLRQAGFNTVFITLYPIHGQDWWSIPPARDLVKDAMTRAHAAGLHVHLGLSLFNGNFCYRPDRFPGASQTIQCDGTKPSWICFFDDRLWDYYIKNCLELARLGKETGALDGIFLDPESYGPECYLCFCDNCIRKYNAFSGQSMPTGLVKPDSWLLARKLWRNYTVDFHDHEVRRHAEALRDAVHAIDPSLQLSSLLWDYPVAVGVNDPRQAFFRQLALGLSARDKPSWTLPEHTYYSDADDLARILKQIQSDIAAMDAADRIKILPGLRVLRQPASTLLPRASVIRNSAAVGYWLYEPADLNGKTPIDFEGRLIDPQEQYWLALRKSNALINAP